jgi:hypothetical protein
VPLVEPDASTALRGGFAMTDVLMSAFEIACLPAGAVLLVLALWMRRGRTPRARFWVRRWAAWQPRHRLDAEMFFLVWWPIAAVWLLVVGCAGFLSLLGVGAPNLDVIVALLGGLAALAVVTVTLLLSGIGITAPPGGTNLLRPWMYPRWLRTLRATERRWKQEQLLPVGQRSEVGTHPWTALEENSASNGARDMPPSRIRRPRPS